MCIDNILVITLEAFKTPNDSVLGLITVLLSKDL